MFVRPDKSIYEGDLCAGDREATPADLIAWVTICNPPPSFASQKAAELALWKGQREQFMGRLASIASRLRVADPVGAASADAVATDLLGLFTAPAVVAATDIATYKAALKTRYVQAVMLATTTALAEFNKYNQ